MTSRPIKEAEALHAWREAERELRENGDGRSGLEADVARTREDYQRLYTRDMIDSIARLREADQRRARSVPSTPDFHAATQDTEEAAADIWEQARRGDREGPQGDEALENRRASR